MFAPPRIVQRLPDGLVHFEIMVIFRSTLFLAHLHVATRETTHQYPDATEPETLSIGQARLFGEECIMENLPIATPEPPGPFG